MFDAFDILIIRRILKKLSIKDLLNLSLVNRETKYIIETSNIFKYFTNINIDNNLYLTHILLTRINGYLLNEYHDNDYDIKLMTTKLIINDEVIELGFYSRSWLKIIIDKYKTLFIYMLDSNNYLYEYHRTSLRKINKQCRNIDIINYSNKCYLFVLDFDNSLWVLRNGVEELNIRNVRSIKSVNDGRYSRLFVILLNGSKCILDFTIIDETRIKCVIGATIK